MAPNIANILHHVSISTLARQTFGSSIIDAFSLFQRNCEFIVSTPIVSPIIMICRLPHWRSSLDGGAQWTAAAPLLSAYRDPPACAHAILSPSLVMCTDDADAAALVSIILPVSDVAPLAYTAGEARVRIILPLDPAASTGAEDEQGATVDIPCASVEPTADGSGIAFAFRAPPNRIVGAATVLLAPNGQSFAPLPASTQVRRVTMMIEANHRHPKQLATIGTVLRSRHTHNTFRVDYD